MKMKVLACDGIHEDGLSLFRAAGWDVAVAPEPLKDPAALAAALDGVDALLVRSATPVTAAGLAGGNRLRVIGRAGAGVDTIDVEAATARGIAVMNAADGNTRAAAEHALSLLFALARHVPRADAGMKAGQWPKAGLTGFELEGKKLGVIGLGRIGGTVARKARGIGMEVAAHDPFLPSSAAAHGSVPLMTLPELLAWADVVTLHIPRTKDTTHLLDARSLALMKPGAYLVNAARGGLVDEAALPTGVNSCRRRGRMPQKRSAARMLWRCARCQGSRRDFHGLMSRVISRSARRPCSSCSQRPAPRARKAKPGSRVRSRKPLSTAGGPSHQSG